MAGITTSAIILDFIVLEFHMVWLSNIYLCPVCGLKLQCILYRSKKKDISLICLGMPKSQREQKLNK